MTFYDYYRYRLYASLARIQQDFALRYAFGPYQKAGDSGRGGREPIQRLPMRTIGEILLQEQAVKDVRPGITLNPENFTTAGEVADGAAVMSESLTGVPAAVRTFGEAVAALSFAIENEV